MIFCDILRQTYKNNWTSFNHFNERNTSLLREKELQLHNIFLCVDVINRCIPFLTV